MKCKFCQKQMLPLKTVIEPSANFNHGILWECLLCPHSVRQHQDLEDYYSIMYFYKNSWYEISQDQSLFSIFRHDIEKTDENTFTLSSKVILERQMIAGITPTNIDSKFPTLMVFS